MSHENVEIVRECCEALDRGDYAAALEALHPEISYELTHFPDGQIYRGHEGVRKWFRIWLGTWEDYHLTREEIIDAGEHVVVATREYGRGKGSGLQLDRLTWGIWTLRRGKVTRIQFRSSRAEALQTAGLAEQDAHADPS
jgi:ketosteroid isomerase-like protein